MMKRKDFIRIGGMGAVLGAVPATASAAGKNRGASAGETVGPIPNPQVASLCQGSGTPPLYSSLDGNSFELDAPGDPWHHADGSLGMKELKGEFDADLQTGFYSLEEALEMRAPSSIRGKRSGFGNPNGEFPPVNGTCVRFEKQGIRVGREAHLMDNGTDDRISNPVIENLTLYRDPLNTSQEHFEDGAAVWADAPSDQLTINNLNASCCYYGLLITSYLDAFRIRGMHTGRVTHPLFIASKEEAGKFTATWYGTVSDSCFADGDGPVVLQGDTQPWNFSNVNIVRQGRKQTDFPPCNIYWAVSQGRFDAGVIDSPGRTFHLSDGKGRRTPAQIDADGMILKGSKNTISTLFKDASGKGKANLHLLPGSNRNIIRSQFAGCKEGAVDLIIEEGCEENLVYVSPGMTIIDRGVNTHYIGKELAVFK